MKVKYTILYTSGVRDVVEVPVDSEEAAHGVLEVNETITGALRDGCDAVISLGDSKNKGLLVGMRHVMSVQIETIETKDLNTDKLGKALSAVQEFNKHA